MKRTLLLCLLIVICVSRSSAVLKEKDLSNTLAILRSELTDAYRELEFQNSFMKEQREQVGKNIFAVLNRSNQNSLMLYSQKPEYIFDLTYACHEATEQYHEFKRTVLPFSTYVSRTATEIARYDSLIVALNNIRAMQLDQRGQIDRNVCLTLATTIRHSLQDNTEQLEEYIHYYDITKERLKYLNDYANKRYYDIQTSIFRNEGENYLTILSNLGDNIEQAGNIVLEKYKPQEKVHSQWDSRMIIGLFIFIAFYAAIALGINIVLIKVILPRLSRFRHFKRMGEGVKLRQSYILSAATVVTFAVLLGVARIFINQNFFIMASNLLVEYAWLLSAIFISLLLRLDNDKLKSTIKVYAPLIFIGFVVISFRIVLVPNDVVKLVLPPTLLACTIWQWAVARRQRNKTTRSDSLYSFFSLFIFIVSVVSSWQGYTLFSVQVLIWWVMQLTCILTITCFSGYLKRYAERHDFASKPITETWVFDFVYTVIVPILGVLSVVISIYWAAGIFNLSDTIRTVFMQRFIDSKYISLSIFSICQVAILYYIFAYINRTAKALAKLHFEKSDQSTAATRNVMTRNVIQVVVWGIWLLISLGIFKINNTWFVVISGGLSTGVGFAMKDILENIYYGISLMAGRIKVGDLIECDGIRGRVSSINYTSTLLDTVDGSVIAFQNSQLFTKNYRNLTKNHGYEMAKIPVGVAYGSDPIKVKELLIKAVSALKCRNTRREVKVVFREFGDSSLNFLVLVWVPALSRTFSVSEILETIYVTLNENNIEIPFPQRDVRIVKE